MRSRSLFTWLALALALTSGALADAPSLDAQLQRAEDAIFIGEIYVAVNAFESVIADDPSSRQARRARARLQWIKERGERSYGPLSALQRFRTLEISRRDAEHVTAFALLVDAMPEGRVRLESLRIVAAEWMRLGDPSRAAALYERLSNEDLLAASERSSVVGDWAAALRAAGREEQAIALLSGANMSSTARSRQMVNERTARWAIPLALTILFLTLVCSVGFALRRDTRETLMRAFSKVTLLRIAYVTVVPWLIATAYDDETSDTFGWLALGVGFVLVCAELVAARFQAKRPAPNTKMAFGTLMFAAMMSVAYLVLWKSGNVLGVL